MSASATRCVGVSEWGSESECKSEIKRKSFDATGNMDIRESRSARVIVCVCVV